MSRRSEVVAVGDWRARLERRAAAGRRGRASSGDRKRRLGFRSSGSLQEAGNNLFLLNLQ